MEINEGTLKLHNHAKPELVQMLQEKKFLTQQQIDGKPGGQNFDYLLSMAIWSLTKEKVDQLTNQLEQKRDALAKLEKSTIEELWREDLQKFRNDWNPGRQHQTTQPTLPFAPVKKTPKKVEKSVET